MKQIFIDISVLLFLSVSIFGQGIEREVENGIFLTFPKTPKYETTTDVSSYEAVTENCYYMVLIQRNAIPYYTEFVETEKSWTETQKKQFRDVLLDNAVKGRFEYFGNTGTVTEIKKGSFYGRKVEYSAVNPATGESGKRYLVMLSVRDKLINFECVLLQDNNYAVLEKDKFINSISISSNNTVSNQSNATSTTQDTIIENFDLGSRAEEKYGFKLTVGGGQQDATNRLAYAVEGNRKDLEKYGYGNLTTGQFSGDVNSLLSSVQSDNDRLFNKVLVSRIIIVGGVFILPLALSIIFVKKRKMEDCDNSEKENNI